MRTIALASLTYFGLVFAVEFSAVDLPPMTTQEVQAEIKAARAARRADADRR